MVFFISGSEPVSVFKASMQSVSNIIYCRIFYILQDIIIQITADCFFPCGFYDSKVKYNKYNINHKNLLFPASIFIYQDHVFPLMFSFIVPYPAKEIIKKNTIKKYNEEKIKDILLMG